MIMNINDQDQVTSVVMRRIAIRLSLRTGIVVVIESFQQCWADGYFWIIFDSWVLWVVIIHVLSWCHRPLCMFCFFPSNQWIDSRNREDSCIGASMRWVVSGGSCWSFQITHRLVELCFCQATGELNFPSEEIGEAWVVWRCTTIGRLGAECERVRYLTCTFCCLLDWKLN